MAQGGYFLFISLIASIKATKMRSQRIKSSIGLTPFPCGIQEEGQPPTVSWSHR
jgi:hypothetical protein